MPFGAHEAMETHEVLTEKICMIEQFSRYITQCQDPALRDILDRHRRATIQSYDEIVRYTHDYSSAQFQVAQSDWTHPSHIQYGLRGPQPVSPQMGSTHMNDRQIATGALLAHKCSAKNHMAASLECADPNVRQMMVNGSVACSQMAYEVFQYMNRHGMYQVPTLDSHTAKTFLHQYEPYGHAPGYQHMMPQPALMSSGIQNQTGQYPR